MKDKAKDRGQNARHATPALRPEDGEGQSHEGLRGGCAFAPHPLDRSMLQLHRSRSTDQLALGAGELEFGTTPEGGPGTPVVRQRARSWRFTGEELRAVCDAVRERSAPAGDGCGRLVLLEVGPRMVHAYWEIGEDALASLRTHHGARLKQARTTLRFYEITQFGQANTSFDVEVEEGRSNCFTPLESSSRRYVAEVGLKLPDGTFERLARSNPVELLPDEPAEREAREHMFVDPRHTPRRRPALPAIYQTEEPTRIECLDDPGRDRLAEARIREVYRRVLNEGPRVLAGRPAIAPTPSEAEPAKQTQRPDERRRSGASAPSPAARPRPTIRRPAEAPAPRLPARIAERSVRATRRSEALALARSVAETAHVRAEPDRPAAPAALLPGSVREADRRPDSGGDAPRKPPVRNTTLETPMSLDETTDQNDPFLSGLGVEAGPEPERYVPDVRRPAPGGTPRRPTARGPATPEAFLAGLDLNDAGTEERSSLNATGPVPAEPAVSDKTARPEPEAARETREPQQTQIDAPVTGTLGAEESMPAEPVVAPSPARQTPPGPVAEPAAPFGGERPEEHPVRAVCPGPDLPEAIAVVSELPAEAPIRADWTETNEPPAPAPQAPARSAPQRSAAPGGLELEATLRLTGRAPAGATLHLDGREIPVSEDGTFTLECSIDDGVISLPITMRTEEAPASERRLDVDLSMKRSTRHAAWDRVRLVDGGSAEA